MAVLARSAYILPLNSFSSMCLTHVSDVWWVKLWSWEPSEQRHRVWRLNTSARFLASCQLVSFSSWIPELVGLLSANCEVENRADDAIFVLLFHICHLETDDVPDTKHLTAGWIPLPWITLFPLFNSFNKVSGVCLFQGESCRQEQLLVSIPFCELKLIKCRCEKPPFVWF